MFVYKTKKDVVYGAPLEDSEILNNRKDQILKIIDIDGVIRSAETGDSTELINTDSGIRIRLEDGKEGWIGGLHMVWDK